MRLLLIFIHTMWYFKTTSSSPCVYLLIVLIFIIIVRKQSSLGAHRIRHLRSPRFSRFKTSVYDRGTLPQIRWNPNTVHWCYRSSRGVILKKWKNKPKINFSAMLPLTGKKVYFIEQRSYGLQIKPLTKSIFVQVSRIAFICSAPRARVTHWQYSRIENNLIP